MRKKTVTGESCIDEASLLQTAIDAFVKELDLEDDTLLKEKVEVREIPAGTCLMQEESHKVMFIFGIRGTYLIHYSIPRNIMMYCFRTQPWCT